VPNNKAASELGAISEIIDANPRIMDLICSDAGREGMTVEQVLRRAIFWVE